MDNTEPTGVELSGKKKSPRAKRFVITVLITAGVLAAAAVVLICIFV